MVVTQRSDVRYRRFRGPYCLVETEATTSLETLIPFHVTTRRHIPEDIDLQLRRENLKSRTMNHISV